MIRHGELHLQTAAAAGNDQDMRDDLLLHVLMCIKSSSLGQPYSTDEIYIHLGPLVKQSHTRLADFPAPRHQLAAGN